MLKKRVSLALVGTTLLVFLFLSGCLATSPVTGMIYSDVAGPHSVAGELDENMLVGRATAQSILGLFASGDASIQTAARSAGITDIRIVDYESTNILGFYATFTTVVYGTGPGLGVPNPADTAVPGVSGTVEATMQVIEYNGMEWMIGPDQSTSWYAACDWVASLGDDWRMPTMTELENLYNSGISVDNWGPFGNSGSYVWSSYNEEDDDVATNFNYTYGQERMNAKDYSNNGRAFATRQL